MIESSIHTLVVVLTKTMINSQEQKWKNQNPPC